MQSQSPISSGEARPARGARVGLLWLLALAFTATSGSFILSSQPAEPARVAHGVLPRTASNALVAERRASGREPAPTTTSTQPAAPAPAAATRPTPVEDTTLLSPADVPAPGATLPITVLGRIQIPKIGLDTDLRDQITEESIDLGPSHWPGTAAPGGYGNAVIAGHRNSHSAPFRDLGELVAGDTISLVAGGRTSTYTVTEIFVVTPEAMWITEQTPGHSLTLFTCHPLGESSQRLVIRATLA